MANDAYLKELKRILDDKEPTASGRSREVIKDEIGKISEALRGHLSNVDRLNLVEARQRRRNELAGLADQANV